MAGPRLSGLSRQDDLKMVRHQDIEQHTNTNHQKVDRYLRKWRENFDCKESQKETLHTLSIRHFPN
jgi:hypothetical protein